MTKRVGDLPTLYTTRELNEHYQSKTTPALFAVDLARS